MFCRASLFGLDAQYGFKHEMKCLFINLESAADRRAALERNFAAHAPASWSLERFSAVDVTEVQRRQLTGRLRATEIACAASHFELVHQQKETRVPFLILEDDVLFGPHSCETLQHSVDWLNAREDWDILFPDLCIVQIGAMAEMLALRRQLMAQGQTHLLDPRGLAFSSATSYILHPRAVPKILARQPANWDVPYDLLLRQWVQQNVLRARYIFPFALSLEDTSNASTIQPGSDARTGYIWYLFRRMIWRDGDFSQHLAELEEISADLSPESLAYGRLWAAMADPSFRPK